MPWKEPLREHFERVKEVHQRDLDEGWGRVQMPSALDRKYPKRARRLALAMGLPAGEQVEEHENHRRRPASHG